MSTNTTATFSVGEAAARLHITEPSIYRYLKRGWLVAVRDDSYAAALRVVAESLREFQAAAADAARLSYTTGAAARRLGTGQRMVQRLVRQGVLDRYPAPGRVLRVSMQSVETLRQRRLEEEQHGGTINCPAARS